MAKIIEKIGVLKISFIVPAIIIALVHFFLVKIDTNLFANFYTTELRNNLFAAFLTLGGFLYSLKTLIIIKMKENVYDHEKYLKKIERKRRNNSEITHYGALRRLSDLLYYTVFFSLCTSLLQFTLGLYEHWFTALICSYSALVCICMFAFSLMVIKQNLNYWFEFLEEEKSK